MNLVCALTGVTISLLQWGIDRFAEQTRSASPRLGQKVARFTATDEVLSYMYYQNKPYLTMFAPEGDGCLQRAKREDAGRFSKEGKSFDDFWYTPSRRRRSEAASPP